MHSEYRLDNLGYVVSKRVIEANPNQIKNILSLERPITTNSLVGRIVALGRFIAKISDICKPLLESMKKTKNKEIKWEEEQDEALKQIKDYLTNLPILSALERDEELFLYLANSDVLVSAVLFREENKKQIPIFYVSKMITEVEKRCGMMETLVLALVHAKRKLRNYFESHLITNRTNQPLKTILSKPDLTSRLTKWVIELEVYDIQIKPRTSKKGQHWQILFPNAPN